MQYRVTSWWVVPLVAVLSGCGAMTDNKLIGGEDALIRDRGQDYEKAQVQPPLLVPGELDSGKVQNMLEVPDIGTAAIESEQEYEIPRPDFFIAEAGNEKVNLDRQDGERLIIVEEPLEQVWSKMDAFWSANQVSLALQDPQQGMMETAWVDAGEERPGFFARLLTTLTFRDLEGPAHDKLRVYLKPVDGNSQRTSLTLRHLRVPLNEPDQQPDWSLDAENVSYKSQVMYEILHYLSRSANEATASAERERQARRGRAYFGRSNEDQPILKLTVSVDKAWDQVGAALQQAQIDVGSSNRQLGKYYLTYTTELPVDTDEDSPGFFAWLHGEREDITISSEAITRALGGDVEEDPDAPVYSSKPKEPLPSGSDEAEQQRLKASEGYKIWLGDRVLYVFGSGEQSEGTQVNPETGDISFTGRYQVKLSRRSSGIYISVLNDQAQPAPRSVAEELLWTLRENMPETL